MFVWIEILDLVLYCAQQLGVMLAVGAETVLLISYILSMRDGKIDDTEANFIKAMRRILGAGLLCIILSGVAIVALHMSLGQANIVFSPVFLFKWLLVAALALFFAAGLKKQFLHYAIEGFIGATWYALFFVHIVAPAVDWASLFGMYAVFATLFTAIWAGSVHSLKLKAQPHAISLPKPAIASKHAQPKLFPAVSKPIVPLPVSPVAAKPAASVEPAVTPKSIAPLPAATKPVALAAVPAISKPVIPAAPLAPVPSVVMETPVAPKPPISPTPPRPVLVAQKPEDVHHSLWLPAIHVMPKNEQELNDQSHITPLSRLTKTT